MQYHMPSIDDVIESGFGSDAWNVHNTSLLEKLTTDVETALSDIDNERRSVTEFARWCRTTEQMVNHMMLVSRQIQGPLRHGVQWQRQVLVKLTTKVNSLEQRYINVLNRFAKWQIDEKLPVVNPGKFIGNDSFRSM
jgi:hypothetical protein